MGCEASKIELKRSHHWISSPGLSTLIAATNGTSGIIRLNAPSIDSETIAFTRSSMASLASMSIWSCKSIHNKCIYPLQPTRNTVQDQFESVSSCLFGPAGDKISFDVNKIGDSLVLCANILEEASMSFYKIQRLIRLNGKGRTAFKRTQEALGGPQRSSESSLASAESGAALFANFRHH